MQLPDDVDPFVVSLSNHERACRRAGMPPFDKALPSKAEGLRANGAELSAIYLMLNSMIQP